jgi:uncharacterized protein (UPF0332 family)
MPYEELLAAGRIRRVEASRKEVDQALQRAQRDLATARKIMAEDWDWGFAVAYNAVLQASRAYMFAQGYRPASAEGHKNTFAFMREALGQPHEKLIGYFDRMRNKRHQAMYDVAGMISETEARSLLKEASDFVAFIARKLGRRT